MKGGWQRPDQKRKEKDREVMERWKSCEAMHSVNCFLLWLAGRYNQSSAARFCVYGVYVFLTSIAIPKDYPPGFTFFGGDSVCLCKGCQGTEIVIPTSNLGVWVKINCCSWLFYGPKIWLLKTPAFTIWAFCIQTIKCLGYIDRIQADFLPWNCASLMITPACFLNLETSCFPQRILHCLSLGKKCLCATIMKFIELKNSPEMGLLLYTQFS